MQGLPGSGKSTKAKEIWKADGNAIRITKDLLREMLHFNEFSGKNEQLTMSASVALADRFLTLGKNVIIDDTNLNPRIVNQWQEFTKHDGRKLEIVKMDTPIDVCIERDAMRVHNGGRHVGTNVIKAMARQYGLYYNDMNDVICDLDGTLCDIEHRLHYVKNCGDQPKDWKSFFANMSDDTMREDVAAKLLPYRNTHNIVFVSGRPNEYRKETEKWLSDHFPLYDTLIMRRENDKRPDTEVKRDILKMYFRKEKIDIVFDDRPSVIRMWREEGLNVEDVGKGIEF